MVKENKFVIPDNINWEYLKRFKICAQSSNFKDAAKVIGTSWNALSKQIDALENSLGVQLFEHVHHNRSNRLTESGEYLYRVLINIEFYLQGGLKLSTFTPQERQWEVKISSTPGLISTFLPDFVTNFSQAHENCELELQTNQKASIVGENEVVIRADFKLQNDIEKIKLLNLSMNLYASEEYVAAYGAPETIADLIHHKMIFNLGNSNWAFLRSHQVKTIPIKSDSIEFSSKLCLQGLGILELPHIHPLTQKLVRVLRKEESPMHPIYVAYLKTAQNNPGINLFVSSLLEYVKQYAL